MFGLSMRMGRHSPVPSWIAQSLFRNGEQGVIYDPNDLSTLYQDSAGTTPVTASGQPVGLMLDKSRGLVRGPELVTNGAFSVDTNGWSASANASIAWSPAGMVVTRTGTPTYPSGNQQVGGLTVGKLYELTCSFSNPSNVEVYLGFSGFVAVQRSTSASGTLRSLLVATATTHRLDAGLWSTSGSVGQSATFDNISVRELPGNHAFQSTAASRPILRQTPILGPELVVNGDFSNGTVGWTAINAQTFSNVGGELTATTNTAVYAAQQNVATTIGKTYIVTASGRRVSASPFVRAHSGTAELGFSQTGSTSNAPISFTFVASTTSTQINLGTPGGLGQAFWDNISVREITGYYTDRNYLETDGVDDWMSTSAIDFTGTDKVSVFTGVRKLGTAAAIVVELSNSVTANAGSFFMAAPDGLAVDTFGFRSRGTAAPTTSVATGFAAPFSAVLTGSGSISADVANLRVNGALAAQQSVDQGTGTYGNHPLYLFRRGGTTLPFTGHFYGLTIVGRLTTDAETSSMERLLAQRTGVQLA